MSACAHRCIRGTATLETLLGKSGHWQGNSERRARACNRFTEHFVMGAREKVGCFVRQPTQVIRPELSAYVGNALLRICLGRGRWLRRQLKHRCFLTHF